MARCSFLTTWAFGRPATIDADPTRRAILERLSQGQASVSELAEPLREATDWLETYRVVWEGRMDRLDAHLENRRRKR